MIFWVVEYHKISEVFICNCFWDILCVRGPNKFLTWWSEVGVAKKSIQHLNVFISFIYWSDGKEFHTFTAQLLTVGTSSLFYPAEIRSVEWGRVMYRPSDLTVREMYRP